MTRRTFRIAVLAVVVLALAAGSVWAATINGTARNDTLWGSARADKINGKGGNDKLYGLGGNDVLVGGPGNDLLVGGAAGDRLVGGPGRDTMRCGAGKDTATADAQDVKPGKDCEIVKGLAKTPPRINRSELKACLTRQGLAPEDTGLFIIGSAGTNVEALGARVAAAGRVLLFVFEGGATSWVDYISTNFARGAFEVRAIGNVVLVYERAPSSNERARIEGCLKG